MGTKRFRMFLWGAALAAMLLAAPGGFAAQVQDKPEAGAPVEAADTFFFRSKLSRLFQSFLERKFITLSEKLVQIILIKMYVFVRSVDFQFVTHNNLPLFFISFYFDFKIYTGMPPQAETTSAADIITHASDRYVISSDSR